MSGEIRFRNAKIAKNEELPGVADSLNAVNENVLELFLLPLEYTFFNTAHTKFWLGGGIYYEYDKLSEKGFFNMPVLENLNPPRERVNSYTNDFSLHIAGPLIDTGIQYRTDRFSIAFSGGIVPVFLLASSQKTSIVPLLDPHVAENSQFTWGSPYVYVQLDGILFKYINLLALYDFVRLQYQTIDFDDNLNWIHSERTVMTQSLKLEASLLLPMGPGLYTQIGYGYTFDITRLDSGSPVNTNRQYVILTIKKTGR
jgi:hypothetical protein